jgi:hypothetical protein
VVRARPAKVIHGVNCFGCIVVHLVAVTARTGSRTEIRR